MAEKKNETKLTDPKPDEHIVLPIDQIVVDDTFNLDPTRTGENDPEIRQLALDIASKGLINPITVRAIVDKKGTTYYLIAGFRRYTAIAKILKQPTVAVVVKHCDELGALLINGAENTDRKDPHPFYVAKRIARIRDKHLFDNKNLAIHFGISESRVRNLLRVHDKCIPRLLDVFKSPATAATDAEPMKWLIEVAKETPERQGELLDERTGAKANPEEGKPKKKAKKDDSEKGPAKRKMEAILDLRHRILRRLSEKEREAGKRLELLIPPYCNDSRSRKLTDRDIDILVAILDWVVDAEVSDVVFRGKAEEHPDMIEEGDL